MCVRLWTSEKNEPGIKQEQPLGMYSIFYVFIAKEKVRSNVRNVRSRSMSGNAELASL